MPASNRMNHLARCGMASVLTSLLLLQSATVYAEDQAKPNVVLVLCDDLGYGDVQCLNPERGKIATPNIDQFASQGMTFTDAHSGSSVCTPTRYGIMTGRYSWRTKLQNGVVQAYSPSLIKEDRVTIAGFLQTQGYHTAAIGKWHLNMQYIAPDGNSIEKSKDPPAVGAKIPDGPVARGFDYFHGFHHSRDMKAVIENDQIIEHDEVVNMLPRLAEKSVEYIKSRKGKDQPFFLYVPLSSPHTPIVPTPEWKGKSGLGDYGDFVMQTDDVFGQVVKSLEECGMAENTLVIFASDNGCSRAAKIGKLREQGHYVSANFRGSKSDIWDGGHRIPLIVRWPGKIKESSSQADLICLNDIYATVAEHLGAPIPKNSCEDSVSFLPQLLGRANPSKRTNVIHHSINGHFAYRSEDWKLILARGSGGWSAPNENKSKDMPKAQLYDMSSDPSEQKNLFETDPRAFERLLKLLSADVANGRTTQGPDSSNDVENVDLWKSEDD